jgi:hypothetical protein
MIFDKLVFKEGSKYYIDTNNSNSECDIYVGDNIKFSYNNEKFFAKVINSIDNVYELYIIEKYGTKN